jgi:hypothetical protein
MNWTAVGVLAYVLLGVQLALSPSLELGAQVIPMIVFTLVVHVALHAPARGALWMALLTGLGVDLTSPAIVSQPGGSVTTTLILGPTALGYLAASYFVITLRPMVARNSLLAAGVITTVAGAIAHIAMVVLLSVRSTFDSAWGFDATRAMWAGFGSALYTGVAGAVLFILYRWLAPVLGTADTGRRFGRTAR